VTPDPAPDALAPRLSLPDVVTIYEKAERDIRDGLALIVRAQAELGRAFGSGHGVRIADRWDRLYPENADDVMEQVRRQCWRELVERLELRRFMSVKAWNELSQQIEKGEPPELTRETVLGMADHYRNQLPEMLEQAVEEVFDWLRPQNGRYKTNSKLEIRQRVILAWVVEPGYGRSKFWTNHRYEPELSALENVFTALDGRGSVTKGHYSELSSAIKASPDGKGETRYFWFKCCKNRNLHLEFKRLDLLARFNAIAGGRRLRPKKEAEG
jgi:hypothetical protein